MSPTDTIRWWARWFLENLFGSRWRPLETPWRYKDEPLYSDFGYTMTRRKPLFGGSEFRDRSLFRQLKPRRHGDNILQFKRTPSEYRQHGIPHPRERLSHEVKTDLDRTSALMFDGKLQQLRDPNVTEFRRPGALFKPLSIEDIAAVPSPMDELKEKALTEIRERDKYWPPGALCVVLFNALGNAIDPHFAAAHSYGYRRELRMVLSCDPPQSDRLELQMDGGAWLLTGPARHATMLDMHLHARIAVPTYWLQHPTDEEVAKWQEKKTTN